MSDLTLSLLFVFLSLSGAIGVTVDPKCAPSCEGVEESGTQVMDPSNCAGYYDCVYINGEYVLSDRLECPDGEYFNINVVPPQCASIASAHEGYCEGYCNPCEVQCSVPDTLRPDPTDCSKFYYCLSEGASQLVSCGTGKYFDYIAEVCQDYESLCYPYCDEEVAYCVETGLVADPADCQKYFYCDPPALVPFTCNSGQYFDPDEGICVDGSCVITTTSSVPLTSTTTSTDPLTSSTASIDPLTSFPISTDPFLTSSSFSELDTTTPDFATLTAFRTTEGDSTATS